MKKLLLLIMLLCAMVISGCDSNRQEETKNPAAQTQTVKEQSFIVYRASADGSEKLLPEKLTIKDNGKPVAENALRALVGTKPGNAKYDDVVPIGTKLLSLRIEKDGTAYADFSRELAKRGQGSYGELMLCYAITNTLTEFKEIKRVQILVEGKKVESLSGHMDVDEPLTRNESLL